MTRLSRAGPLCGTGPGPDPRTWAAPPGDRRRGKRAPAAAGRAPTRRPGSARRPPLAGSEAREAEAAGVAVAGRADRGGWPSAGTAPDTSRSTGRARKGPTPWWKRALIFKGQPIGFSPRRTVAGLRPSCIHLFNVVLLWPTNVFFVCATLQTLTRGREAFYLLFERRFISF